MRKGHPRREAIKMARGILNNAASSGKWGRGMVKNPAVKAGALASRAQRASLSNEFDLGEDGARWKHDYIPLNAAALAIKEHRHVGTSPRQGRSLSQALSTERKGKIGPIKSRSGGTKPGSAYDKVVLGGGEKKSTRKPGGVKPKKSSVPKVKPARTTREKAKPVEAPPAHLDEMSPQDLHKFMDETHSMPEGPAKAARLDALRAEKVRRVEQVKKMQEQAKLAQEMIDKEWPESDEIALHSKFVKKLFKVFPALRKHRNKLVNKEGKLRGKETAKFLIEETKKEVFKNLAGPFITAGLFAVGVFPHLGGG